MAVAFPMQGAVPMQGVLQVAGPAELDRRQKADDAARAKAAQRIDDTTLDSVASYIDTHWQMMKNHRNSAVGWSQRMIDALLAFNGTYDPAKLAEIKKFGGSEVYARLISMKCRGTSSLLRDVYLNTDKPWGIEPPADPDVPVEIMQKIGTLVQGELQQLQQMGQMPDAGTIRDRINDLVAAARQAEKKQADTRAKLAEDRIQEILVTGGFYKALAELVTDVPLFPVACLKGPVVKILPTVDWSTGKATVIQKPTLTWARISPFDLWWSSGAADIESADVIERSRLSRGELNDLLDLPGYNQDKIRMVLTDYANGYTDAPDYADQQRANQESRESPTTNQTGLITCLEFNGHIQGQMLLDWGMEPKLVPDPIRDYAVQCWKIGRHVVKVQLSPSPRKRHPYFITSFEKVPGTPVGNALPDILTDLQDVTNATLRALVNNMSISSGPQVVINDDRLGNGENGDDLYPWKRWHVTSDPMGNTTQQPVSFFMPTSNAGELISIYAKFSDMADEMSAIPKYMSGVNAGNVGRTSSGLSMLMANASKILQTVASNIDGDIIGPALAQLFDMIMLTDTTGVLRGDESVRVLGVNVATQRETERVRQIEFLGATGNPIDMQIMGVEGRAAVLRSVAQTIGITDKIVPSDSEIQSKMAAPPPGPPGVPPGQPGVPTPQDAAAAQGGQQSSPVNGDQGPRLRLTGGPQ